MGRRSDLKVDLVLEVEDGGAGDKDGVYMFEMDEVVYICLSLEEGGAGDKDAHCISVLH